MTSTTAVRTTIKLGNIEIEVFQLQSGTYYYSQTQAFMAIANDVYDTKQAAKRYIEKITSKQAQTYIPEGFDGIEKVKISGERITINAITQSDVTKLWKLFALDGNVKAVDLLTSCAIEALERRADAAFGKVRSEEEYNNRLAARLKGKQTRRTMTDSIRDWLERHSDEISDNTRKFIYSNVSDCLNRAVFNKSASQLCEERKCEKEKLRDTHDDKELKKIDSHEEFTMKLIDKFDRPPLEAMKEAIEFYQ